MKVEVTKQDIERGIKWSKKDCPLARAIKRAFGAQCVTVDSLIRIGDEQTTDHVFEVPADALTFREAFDNSRKGTELEAVAPFAFNLQPPAPETRGLFDEVQ